jgi:hypothetical protein
VEWFDQTKRRVLTETSSTQPIEQAQPFVQHGTDAKSKKRKLNNEAAAKPSAQHPDDVSSTAPDQDPPLKELQVESELQVNNARPQQVSSGRGTPAAEEKQQAAKRQADMAETRTQDTHNDGQSMGSRQHGVFLLKPRTSTSRHVLMPLDPTRSLGESLHGRTILEFPTIYVFPDDMDKLPEDFMLEEEYAKVEGEQQREFDEMMKELDPEILRRLKEDDSMPRDSGGGDEHVDSKKILDVLKQDLGGRL